MARAEVDLGVFESASSCAGQTGEWYFVHFDSD